MPTYVNLKTLLAERNPGNWVVTVTGSNVTAFNNVTKSYFEGTVTQFNAYLAVQWAADLNVTRLAVQPEGTPETLYDLATGEVLVGTLGQTGPQGIKGDTGDKGDKGDKGDTGNTGPTGPQGIQGIKGDKGNTGNIGQTGPAGPQGVAGPQGTPGVNGIDGTQGAKGDKGDIGNDGPQGIQGVQGLKGNTGDTGPQGPTGPQGLTGPQGPTGADSTVTGPTGPQGLTGPQGIQGIKGDKGDTGNAGADGAVGPTGSQGIQGVKGDTGDTGPAGSNGANGADGAAGADGADGIDATVLSTGFLTPATVGMTYNPTTRKITITANGQAVVNSVSSNYANGWESDAHAAGDGLFFLYQTGGVTAWSTTPWVFSDLLIAAVYVDSSITLAIRECHGLMDPAAHKELHSVIGTYLSSGLDMSGVTLNSTTAAQRRPLVSGGVINDEDIPTTIAAITTNNYTLLQLSGSTQPADVVQNQTEIISVTGNVPNWNSLSGNTWGQTAFTNNQYGKIFVMAIPVVDDATAQKNRILFIQPQQVSTTLGTIQAVQSSSLNLGQLAGTVPEFCFIGEIIIRYRAGGTNNWDIISYNKILGTKSSQALAAAGGGISEAPVDGTAYARKDAAWVASNGGTTGPVFLASKSSATTLPSGSSAETPYETEITDSASCYDPTTGRFTPNVAGWYMLSASANPKGSSSSSSAGIQIRKNGTDVHAITLLAGSFAGTDGQQVNAAGLMYMNGTTDYASVWVYVTGSGALSAVAGASLKFGGIFMRAP